MYHPTVLVTGASGFIGSYLLPYLLDQDYQVIGLSRQANPAMRHPRLKWVQDLEQLNLMQLDYVINLAGESIGKGRWTVARKQQLIHSRVQTTEKLFQFLKQHKLLPKRIISGSAIGYYGIDPAEQWTNALHETAAGQPIFMSELCQQWEQAALKHSEFNIRIIRLGVVLGHGGGVLAPLLFPIRMNLVGKIGHGKQPLVWVHIQDVLKAIEFLMLKDTEQQIFNVVAPERTSQQDFVRVAARQLKRKPLLTLPAWVLKLLLGEQSQLVVNGQYVKPQALLQAGFQFEYPQLQQALQQLLPKH